MTVEEKAKELVNKFLPYSTGNSNNNTAKQCALIAVDEILKHIPEKTYGTKKGYYPNPKFEFYIEVKNHLKNHNGNTDINTDAAIESRNGK